MYGAAVFAVVKTTRTIARVTRARSRIRLMPAACRLLLGALGTRWRHRCRVIVNHHAWLATCIYHQHARASYTRNALRRRGFKRCIAQHGHGTQNSGAAWRQVARSVLLCGGRRHKHSRRDLLSRARRFIFVALLLHARIAWLHLSAMQRRREASIFCTSTTLSLIPLM